MTRLKLGPLVLAYHTGIICGRVSPTWASALLAAGVFPDEDAPGIRSPSISSWKDGKPGGFLSRKREREKGEKGV